VSILLKDELYAFVPQQERPPGKFRTPPQHVLKDELYAFVPQQERPPGVLIMCEFTVVLI
jgi:hypothetical protein